MEFNASYDSSKQLITWNNGMTATAKLKVDSGTSDGYHTFDELYYHRMILFSYIVNKNHSVAWKSKLHHDGTMYPNYFIVGIDTPEGQYSYHYHLDDWEKFFCQELEHARKWDGHEPKDITRLLSLL